MKVVSFTSRPPYTGAKSLDKREGWGSYWLLRNSWTSQKRQCRTLHTGSRFYFSPNKIMVIKSRRGTYRTNCGS